MVPNILPSSTDHHISYHITLCVAAFFLYPLCTLCVYICYTYVYNICCCCYCSACCILFWFFSFFVLLFFNMFQAVRSSTTFSSVHVYLYIDVVKREENLCLYRLRCCVFFECAFYLWKGKKRHSCTQEREIHILQIHTVEAKNQDIDLIFTVQSD